MSFLTPLFLLGGLAVALPVLFHLIRRTSKEEVPFSSLLFLRPSPPRITRRSRLENLWLLLLRCLVLALLALGFARPYWKTPLAAEPDASRQVAVLLDTSASMQRPALWSEAQARLAETLRELKPGDRAAILRFDRGVAPLLTFEEWQRTPAAERVPTALDRVASLEPSWAGTHLGKALIGAVNALEEAESSGAGRTTGRQEIIVISDLQEGSQFDGIEGYHWPVRVRVRLVSLDAVRSGNAGVHLMPLGQGILGADETGPRILVTNSRDAKRDRFRVHWRGRLLESNAPPREAYVPPGQTRSIPSGAVPAGASELALEADDETFDNRAFFAPAETNVWSVGYVGSTNRMLSTEPLFYLSRALKETGRQRVEIAAFSPDEPLPAGALDKFKLLVLAATPPPESLEKIRAFVAAGGTAVVLLGTAEAGQALAPLLRPGVLHAQEARVTSYAMFSQIDFDHPVFGLFRDPRFNDFTKIRFWHYRQVQLTNQPAARVLARYDSGDPAWIECRIDRGALHLLTSNWTPVDSQFPLSSKFVPVLFALLQTGGVLQSHPAHFVVGDAVEVSGDDGEAVEVRHPTGTTTTVAAGERYLRTDEPGIYEVTGTDRGRRWQFAVNMPSEESRTAPLGLDHLQKLGLPMTLEFEKDPAAPVDPAAARTAAAVELEGQQKLWRWLVAAAVGALLFESALASAVAPKRTA